MRGSIETVVDAGLPYRAGMGDAGSVRDWVMEGPGRTEFADGWMTMDSPDGGGHFTYWCPRPFPGSFLAEWDAQCLDAELGLCIVFFAARGPGGEDLFDARLPRRTGLFPDYTMGLRCYHVSYYANTPDEPRRATSNMRRNPGAHVVAQGPVAIPWDSTAVHRLRLLKDGARVRLEADGVAFIDWADDGALGPALGDGWIGLRQMRWTRFRYRDFRVSAALTPPHA